MAMYRQIRYMKPGTYPRCAVLCMEKQDNGFSIPVWHENLVVKIEEKFAFVYFEDTERRFMRKTNKSLQIYSDMTVAQALAERADNHASNLGLPTPPCDPELAKQKLKRWGEAIGIQMSEVLGS